LGPGAIAKSFAEAMTMVDDGHIVAVASRSLDRAEAFGESFDVPTRYGDYDALAADPDVDAVYIATPHSRHMRDTIAMLKAGKHVLCEKPFALNAREAQQMVDVARGSGLFLMEGVWSRFLPSYTASREILQSGRIGEPLMVEADFGVRMPVDPAHRLFDLEQGGGSLLDLGIYPVQLCSLVLGTAESVVATGVVGETGVDEQVVAVLRHAGDKLGIIKAGIRVGMSCTARISGSEGWIDLPAFMHCPQEVTVTALSGSERIDCSYAGDGLRFEIAEVHRCLAEGLLESPQMCLDESVALATTLDAIRAQIGVVYPSETRYVPPGGTNNMGAASGPR
jgi:predicted dehydrogenase